MSLLYSQLGYNTFKGLSLRRIKDAKILSKNRAYSGAYYLAGYSVELALKACYCKSVKAQSFPDKKVIGILYSHDLNNLMGVSGVKIKFEKEIKTNSQLLTNWEIVKDWSEDSRYIDSIDKKSARALMDAISKSSNGILTWIKKAW